MQAQEIKFIPLAIKTIVVHTVTYFIMGLLAAAFVIVLILPLMGLLFA